MSAVKKILAIIILIFSVILQTTLIPFMDIWGAGPNLILILSLFLVILKRFERVWWMMLLTGLFADLFLGLPFGLASLALVTTAYLIHSFNRSIFSGVKFWTMNSLVILGTLAYALLVFGLGKVFQFDIFFNFKHLLIEVGYNLLISSILYVGIKKIFR